MANVISLLRGQVSLDETGVGAVESVFRTMLEQTTREEIRPMREMMVAAYVKQQELEAAILTLAAQFKDIADVLPRLSSSNQPPAPVAQKVNGLKPEKVGGEIISMLYEKMPIPHPVRLRPFYTDLERESGVDLSAVHKQRTKDMSASDIGHYPYRKIDTILSVLDADYVFKFAKDYEFITK
ncbi:hypothetical protein [Paenibacillus naphthalenovorans]|uniref:hypothetical protein n=1 Tax=Paenibacillus naphthalenovorans TaxID=162209 RepID=UPI003D2D47CE